MNYLRTHVCQFATLGALALTGLCIVMALHCTERWAMLLNAFLAGANFANALYIAREIGTQRRITELTEGCNRLNQASIMLRYSLMNDGWEATSERPFRSDLDKPRMH